MNSITRARKMILEEENSSQMKSHDLVWMAVKLLFLAKQDAWTKEQKQLIDKAIDKCLEVEFVMERDTDEYRGL